MDDMALARFPLTFWIGCRPAQGILDVYAFVPIATGEVTIASHDHDLGEEVELSAKT